MLQKIIPILCILQLHFILSAQNLVLNPSFEYCSSCNGSSEKLDSLTSWTKIAGNPQFINTFCPLSKENHHYVLGMRIPPPYKGKVLVGLGLAKEGEYIQGELKDSLKKGQRYIVRMKVRLPVRFCNTPIQEIGLAFSDQKIKSSSEYQELNIPAIALQNNDASPIKKQFNWETVSVLYTAQGNEKFLCIGNFSSNNQENFAKRTSKECTYIYMDNIEVRPYEGKMPPIYNDSSELDANQRYWFKDINFKTNSDVLAERSKLQLDALAMRLIQNPQLKIELSAHTHNLYAESENIKLSMARAQQLQDYLVVKLVPINQITIKGLGSSMNILLNNSKENRSKNERIEIKVLP